MNEQMSAPTSVGATNDPRPEAEALPYGEYAIVEVLGHRTLVGRVAEVERFGTKFLAVEPVFQGRLLANVLIGGASIYQFTPCSAATALRNAPTQDYQLTASVRATLAPAALPAPDEDDEPEFAPAFLSEPVAAAGARL